MGLCLVLGKLLFETIEVNCVALFSGKFHSHFHRETKCVVKLECCATGNNVARDVGNNLEEFLFACNKCLGELFLFLVEFVDDLCCVLRQLGVDVFVNFDVNLGNLSDATLWHTQRVCHTNCTTDQTAQNVALVDVAWNNTNRVTKKESCCTNVVGNNTHCFLCCFVICLAGEFLDFCKSASKQVDVVDGF